MMFGLEYSVHVHAIPVCQRRVTPRENIETSAARVLQLESGVVVALL